MFCVQCLSGLQCYLSSFQLFKQKMMVTRSLSPISTVSFKGSVCVEVLTSFHSRFFVEEGQFIKYTPSTSSHHLGSHFIHLLTRPCFGAKSSGSQPCYQKLFPHFPHSSKNNFFGIKISQRRDWETPSLSDYGSCLYLQSILQVRPPLITTTSQTRPPYPGSLLGIGPQWFDSCK